MSAVDGQVHSTFLRSNDPRIVQLFHSLSTKGYFLERRAGELDAMLPNEVSELENRYGTPLATRVIPLKDGMQAYVASFYGDPQTAKKDPAKIFTDEGGSFSRILQSGMTAEKFQHAYEPSLLVAREVDSFKKLKRKHYANEGERRGTYIKHFGSAVSAHFTDLDAAVPHITVSALALLYEKHIKIHSYDSANVIKTLTQRTDLIWEGFIEMISAKHDLRLDKSWPTLLKSGTFFRDVVAHLTPIWRTKPVVEMES